jgi:outer membrane biosynthesis protein TonB
VRGALLGSGAFHLLLLVVLFYVRTPAQIMIPGPDVVQVALLDPAALTAAAPAPTPPAPQPRLEEMKPVEDQGVKLQPPKKKRTPEPEPKAVEPPAPAPPAPTLPSAPAGAAGLRGDVSVDAQNFEFTYYLILVRNKISANWTPPAGLATGGRPVRAVVYFRIGRRGDITATRIETGSGMEFFDRSTVRAVMLSDPLPPLPVSYGGNELGVHFGFDWETP